jgi:hypothetical protein
MSASLSTILEHFAAALKIGREEAYPLLKKAAEVLRPPTPDNVSIASIRAAHLMAVEQAAAKPSDALTANFALEAQVERDEAARILRAAAESFLHNADLDARNGLNKASSVAVELVKAIGSDALPAHVARKRPASSHTPSSPSGGFAGSFERLHDRIKSEPEVKHFARRGPHGSGGGWDS